MKTTRIEFGGRWALVGLQNADGTWSLHAKGTTTYGEWRRMTLRRLRALAGQLLAAERAVAS